LRFNHPVVRFLFILSVFLLQIGICTSSVDGSPKMRRICTDVSGRITINWYQYKDTCQGFYEVLIYGRPDQFTNYKVLDSVKNYNVSSYFFVNGSNYISGSFFVKYVLKCNGIITTISDTLEVDTKPHPAMEPDSISVLPDGSVIVGWSVDPKDPVNDTKSFIIYSVNNGNFPIDTVYRDQALYGVDKKANANKASVSYSIAPVDSCDNVAPIGNTHTTVFLSAGQDSCKYVVTLNWSSYKGWNPKYYEVYYSFNPLKGFKYAGNSAGNSFVIPGLQNLTQYYFFVRAVKNDARRITSSSNRISLVTVFEKDFKYVYIKTVSVVSNAIKIDWTTSNNPQAGYFELYRGLNKGSMKLIATVLGASLVNGLYSYTDTDADNSRIWYYKVKAFNSCGHFGGWSNIPHNIVLKLNKSGQRKDLTWNAYDEWSGGVMLYSVIRVQENIVPVTDYIGQESKTGLSFEDNDSFFNYKRPGICYYIKAVEGDSDQYGFNAESFSNQVCYFDPPVVYIPDAFVPDGGVNYIFKPVVSNVDLTSSSLSIYNKWGELIYFSNEIQKGWDGKLLNGNYAPADVFLYDLRITGMDYSHESYRGTFTLL
jgi:hypothetical protein